MSVLRRLASAFIVAAALRLTTSAAEAQQPIGSVALGDLVQRLGVNTRVLVIGAHPDDEDTYLISWLARGRHVETAYLSLTRGEGGQNLIGNELGYALGQIRTEELLAARRVDGGHQYFTRAVDFGFTKTVAEAEQKWPREMILKDMVAVIRTFRPHVIVSIWTGTEGDGHGHHQYSGVMAKEAFEMAADSNALKSALWQLAPWSVAKLYRVARVPGGFSITTDINATPGNVKYNVGEYSPLFGRSYAEIAALSRSQHLSQGMGMVLPRGTIWDGLTLDTARIGVTRGGDSAIFTGIDTTWDRFNRFASPSLRETIDSLEVAIQEALPLYNAIDPQKLVYPLSRVLRVARTAREMTGCLQTSDGIVRCAGDQADLALALNTTIERASQALVLAAGVTIDALSDREKVALRDSVDLTLAVYNRGKALVDVTMAAAIVEGERKELIGPPAAQNPGANPVIRVSVMRDSVLRGMMRLEMPRLTYPWWLRRGADQDYAVYDLNDKRATSSEIVREMLIGDDRIVPSYVELTLRIDGTEVRATSPIVHRFADPAKGEQRRPVVGVPRIMMLFQSTVEYLRANRPIRRGVRVYVQSALSRPDTVNVQLQLPPGLRADSAARRVVLPAYGKTSVFFEVTGLLKPNEYKAYARVTDRAGVYSQGYIDLLYDHIRPVRYYQPPEMYLTAVDLNLPAKLEVAYVHGVGDNVQRMLEQLDVNVTALAPEALPLLDLRAYNTLVIGPRAYEAVEAVAANAAAVTDFARKGGTVVVQYQQRPEASGVLPYPVTLNRRSADRVTDEHAPVTILAPSHKVMTWPNRITANDFTRWSQERGLYMPRSFDERWKALLETHDPGEPPNYGGVLVAPVGKGTFVYTTLSFFRQLPGGNAGAARLFVNLLSAGLRAGPTP